MTAVYSKHPLRKRKAPGKLAPEDTPDVGDATLTEAQLVLDAIQSGVLTRSQPTPSDSFPRRLTPEQEKILAFRVQTYGDIDARNTLVNKNIGLVHVIAGQHSKTYTGEHREDFIQEGVLGLLRAAETFDPSLDIKFSTYAGYWIYAKMQRFKQRLDVDDEPKIPMAKRAFVAGEYDDSGTHFTDETGRRRRRRNYVLRLDGPVSGDTETENTLADTISDESTPLDEAVGNRVQDARVSAVFMAIVDAADEQAKAARAQAQAQVTVGRKKNAAALAARVIRREKTAAIVRVVVVRRLLSNEPITLADVAALFNDCSRDWIRQVEAKIMKEARAAFTRAAPAPAPAAPSAPVAPSVASITATCTAAQTVVMTFGATYATAPTCVVSEAGATPVPTREQQRREYWASFKFDVNANVNTPTTVRKRVKRRAGLGRLA